MDTPRRNVRALEAFYLEVIKRLPRTLASIFWGAEAVRGVLLYVMSGLVLGALITLKLGNVTAFFAFLLFFLIVAMSLGTFDLYVERMAGGDDAESLHARAVEEPEQEESQESAESQPPPGEPDEPFATMQIGAGDRLLVLRNDLEQLGLTGVETARSLTGPDIDRLGRWVDQVDKRLKTELQPTPYQEARNKLAFEINQFASSGDPFGSARSFEVAANWLQEYARGLDESKLT